jgi:hypothetical protein
MTIAIGIQPASPAVGAVLVTDALVQMGSPTGSQALLCMTPRFHQLEPCDGLAIVSAITKGEWGGYIPSSATFNTAATQLFTSMRDNLGDRAWRFIDGTEVEPGGEIIAAGVDVDGSVRLAHLSTVRGERWANGSGAIYVAGAASEYGEEINAEDMEVPATLEADRALALMLARQVVSTEYRRQGFENLEGFLAAGLVPSFAPPFHVATITPAGRPFQRIQI